MTFYSRPDNATSTDQWLAIKNKNSYLYYYTYQDVKEILNTFLYFIEIDMDTIE